MKALKITATILLSVLLLASCIAAESLALARFTLLNPGFYEEGGREAYALVGRTVVRKLADAVLERAPAIVLRTTDRQEAWALAEKALPPENVAAIIKNSSPDIARFLFYGGNVPELKGSREFAAGQLAVVKGLLTEGVWDMIPEKPSFPAFMPFTPEWNLDYGPALAQELWLPRYWADLADYALWLALAAVTLAAGLLYLLWLRERKPFFATTGALLTTNGMLLLALAAAASFCSGPLAQYAASLVPLNQAANLFASDWPSLVRAVLWPFREIFFISAATALALGVTMFTMGISTAAPAWQPRKKQKAAGNSGGSELKPKASRKPRHKRKT